MPNASIALAGAEVKRTLAPSRRDTGDGVRGDWLRMPRVLGDLPASCRRVFAVFACLADATGRLQISTRKLANYANLSETQARRAVKRLVAVRLLKQLSPGCGTRAAVFQLKWRIQSFPQPSAPPYARVSLAPQRREQGSFAKAKTPPASPTPAPHQLKSWQPSERAIRWALAQARDRLWGLPRHRRERALAALARAFRWAAIQPSPWDRKRWRRFVLNALAKFEHGPDGITEARRRPFGWAMCCAQAALAELAQRDAALEVTEELLAHIRKEKEAAQAEWASYNGPSWRELIGAAKISKNSRGANA